MVNGYPLLQQSSFRARFYQTEAVDQTLFMLQNDLDAAPVIGMPCGTGKSAVIAIIIHRMLTQYPATRITVATHVRELITQDVKALRAVWQEAPYGIYSAGLGYKQAQLPITFTTIQSAVKNPERFGRQHIIIIDEAHLLSPDDETSYQKFISMLRIVNPGLRIIGLTATPYRMKQGYITSDGIFNKFSYDITGPDAFVKLIDMGFLVPLISRPTDFRYDVSKVRRVGGDFNQSDLQRVVNTATQTEQALQEALQAASDRDHWVIFGSGIDHVESITATLQAMGENAVCVHSKMSNKLRDHNISLFRNYDVRMIVNDGILTTGVDFPFMDCIVLLNPTTSPGKHVQILGRGCRPNYASGFDLETEEGRLQAIHASSKHNAKVLDFAGNLERLGPINDPKVPKKKGPGKGEIPIKICPQCGNYNHAAVRICKNEMFDGTICNFEFKFETKIDSSASTAKVIKRKEPELVWYKVNNIEYQPYNKPGSPPMLRVHYYCGLLRFTEYICIEHHGYASVKAGHWWRARRPHKLPPETTEESIQILSTEPVKIPTHILVDVNSKYPSITSYSFDGSTPMYVHDPNHPGHPSYKPKSLETLNPGTT